MKLSRYILLAGLSLPLQNIYAYNETQSVQESLFTDALVTGAVLDRSGAERGVMRGGRHMAKGTAKHTAKSIELILLNQKIPQQLRSLIHMN